MSHGGEFRIGVDVGGTFTDVVGIAADGGETLAKAASTPHDQSEGVLAGLESLAAALGLPLGILLAALVTRALGQYDIRFDLPEGQLVVLVLVSVVAGLLAAVTPARRAAKLDPLRALQYE